MARRGSSVIRNSLDQPRNTLSYLDSEDINESNLVKNGNTFQETVKTEKSVHFATEYESVSEAESTPDSLKTSEDVHTLLPSEHLYSDTFISETQHLYSGNTFFSETNDADSTDPTSNPTEPSYATNTFVALESEDETRTASDISHTDSLASSTVFSQAESSKRSSEDSGTTHREWKDVTDIVKDIDELEESEFVTKHKSFFPDEDEATDITESEDEEMAAIQRDHFLLSTIRRLRLRDVLSPRSLTQDIHAETQSESIRVQKKKVSEEETAFCQQMIKNCRKIKTDVKPATDHRALKPKGQVLEYYGLNSAIVDRLKVQNLQQKLSKKAEDIEKSTQESLQFIKENQHVEAELARQKFISQMLAQVQNENTSERIQAHLIKMHPVKWFADFLNGLPKLDENSREILYKYKRRLEAEKEMNKS
ncbi:hypothetical protein EGW08_004647 [Elysia chlorotica]|uniref:Uncharacterized protein n=1 Tax=Elysia chlorotica TaxID=188477 RepID=A0A3S1CAP6_ELYCH|nr:hypothetical protein EGW08_004647 [Elysia chlorotica]